MYVMMAGWEELWGAPRWPPTPLPIHPYAVIFQSKGDDRFYSESDDGGQKQSSTTKS